MRYYFQNLALIFFVSRRMNGLLQKILKCVQDRHSTLQKPDELPISSLQQMDAVENIDDNGYSNIVSNNNFALINSFNKYKYIINFN